VIGRTTNKIDEKMRTIIEIDDTTEKFKVIFYKKDENSDPRAMKDYNYNDK
jgi:hypothetical protein